MPATATAADPMDELAHRMIRAHCHDTSNPFFVHDHPALEAKPDQIVRGCFYYAVLMGPTLTLLLDNQGRGAMCDMTLDEIVAVWRTRDLLGTFGCTIEELRDGTAEIGEQALPAPVWTVASP